MQVATLEIPLHLATAFVQLYGLWVQILPMAMTILALYSFVHCCSSTRDQRALSLVKRGKQQGIARTPALAPFQPMVPRARSAFTVECVLWVIDNIVKPIADLVWSAASAVSPFVELLNRAFSQPNIQTYVAPIQTRIRQGIAQVPMPAIPDALTLFEGPYRYILPASFLLVLVVALVQFVGVSVGFACSVCFVGYATAVAGDMMSVEELEDARQDEDVEDEEDEENEDARSDTTVLSVGPHAQV